MSIHITPLRRVLAGAILGSVLATATFAVPSEAQELDPSTIEWRTLDGTENNPNDPDLGAADTIYTRVASANYADGIGELVDRPAERWLSNRIFNDVNQNVFSENGVTHWSFVWGQFIDHMVGLRAESDETLMIAFDPTDPLEEFENDLGAITTTRSAAAEGTGEDSVREQLNTVSSYLDGWAIYGGDTERLDWLRVGSLDGDPTNNDASLLLVDGWLPTMLARPGSDAPTMDMMGHLFADPTAAVIAGDVRANENLGLTAVQTLFAREHNRIVALLPDDLDEETKFQLARRIVSATVQWITYEEFLPAMGVNLPDYDGYDSTVDPTITNEFATVGYRAHSAIHGEFEAEIPAERVSDGMVETLEEAGVSVEVGDDGIEIAVPLNVGFGNPALLPEIGLGELLAGLGSEAAYANDEQIDNQLRSVLFQIPRPDAEDPLACLDGEAIADCFTGVNDLGALDVLRGYDHGMPTYNELRVAFGLDPVASFVELTGESTQGFDDALVDTGDPMNDPDILDFVLLLDGDGNELEPGSDAAEGDTIQAMRRTTLAARLAGVFGGVDAVDAFTGMVSEPHVAGTEFGELQLAMWTEQFAALRDGDRFFYANDAVLDQIAEEYGIDYRMTLAEVIAANTERTTDDLSAQMFFVPEGGDDTDDDTDDFVGGTGGGDASEALSDGGADAGAAQAGANDEERDGRGDRDRRDRNRDGDRARDRDDERDRRRGRGD